MVDQNSQFYAILTDVGAAKQANADALGIPWVITQMGVGDANGTDPTPNATQTSLLNEWRRAPLNQLKVDDKNNAIIIAEQVIPADVGGKWIREIGLYDADGDMIAVANCAPTYKPLLSQGSGRTQVVRMNLVVSSSSNVQLKIDPAVVLATREWVLEELARQDFKHSALVATTGHIALSGLQTIDGVALEAGARVLVRNQAAAKDNGLYVAAVGPWARSSDADTSAKVTPGLFVLVERGAANGDSAWQLATDGPINLGVTGLAFDLAWGRTGVAAGTYRSVTVDRCGRVLGGTNPTTVEGYGLIDVYTKTQVDQALTAKAPLDSPVFTGDPKAPTPPSSDRDTSVATTAFVRAVMDAYGLGVDAVNQPLITDFSADLRPGLYRAFSSGHAQASTSCPPDTGDTTMSVVVGGGFTNVGYKTFLAIINASTASRVFVGVKTAANAQPLWTELTTRNQAGVQAYRTQGVFTWQVPTGVKKAWVTVIGGGGGGGRSNIAASGSGGGGGGGLAQKLVSLDGVSSVTVTVGAGGAGAIAEGTAGETGASSSFGSYLSATGGVGGMGLTVSGSHAGPGAGGQGAGGDVNTSTGVGHASYAGVGGSGGGAGGRGAQAPINGTGGLGPGGGGSGAYFGYNGGAGAAGIVIIQW